jgi:hypothetical protein
LLSASAQPVSPVMALAYIASMVASSNAPAGPTCHSTLSFANASLACQ